MGHGIGVRQRSKRIKIRVVIIAAAAAAVVFSALAVWRINSGYAEDAGSYNALREYAPQPDTAPKASAEKEPLEKPADENAYAQSASYSDTDANFAALTQINPDFAGWISIPGTELNYPLVKGEDNQYYLTHGFDGEERKAGAIFVDAGAAPGFTDTNTLIFGHNMKDGSMFAILHNYADPDFLNAHDAIVITLPDGKIRTYRVFSAHKTAADSRDYIGGVWDAATYDGYISRAAEDSDAACAPPDGRPGLITLSTCVRGQDEYRYVVHAALTDGVV